MRAQSLCGHVALGGSSWLQLYTRVLVIPKPSLLRSPLHAHNYIKPLKIIRVCQLRDFAEKQGPVLALSSLESNKQVIPLFRKHGMESNGEIHNEVGVGSTFLYNLTGVVNLSKQRLKKEWVSITRAFLGSGRI
jgi:hypothetical protein